MKKVKVLCAALVMGVLGLAGAAAKIPMYAGGEIGLSFASASLGGAAVGLELTPVFGFLPFADMMPQGHEIAFEVDLQMDFMGVPSPIQYYDNITLIAISPQFWALYTYTGWKVQPVAGIGLGVNIDYMAWKPTAWAGELYMTDGASRAFATFSFALKAGISIDVTDKLTVPVLFRFNVNTSPCSFSGGTASIVCGLRYNF